MKWDSLFEETLRPYLVNLAVDTPLEPDASLSDLGLDSFGTIQLVLELEEVLGCELPDQAFTAKTFATPSTLWAVVGAQASAASGSAS